MKNSIIIGIIALFATLQMAYIVLHSNGIAGYTNSPNETTCTDCHNTYPLNSAGGSAQIKISACINNQYVPGQTYTVSVATKRAGLYLFGLDIEALDSTGANAGTLSLINTGTTVLLNALVKGNNRTNVAQYGGVYSNDSCTFSFKWTAPATNVGSVNLYAATNAANGDGYTYGDYIYTDTLRLTTNQSTKIYHTSHLENGIEIFPNPASINFKVQTSYADKFMLELYDASGKLVLSKTVNTLQDINISTLSNGIYTLITRIPGNIISKRLIVSH